MRLGKDFGRCRPSQRLQLKHYWAWEQFPQILPHDFCRASVPAPHGDDDDDADDDEQEDDGDGDDDNGDDGDDDDADGDDNDDDHDGHDHDDDNDVHDVYDDDDDVDVDETARFPTTRSSIESARFGNLGNILHLFGYLNPIRNKMYILNPIPTMN